MLGERPRTALDFAKIAMNWSREEKLVPCFFLLSLFRRSALFNFNSDRRRRRLPEAKSD
jgi:hypothetical protein